MSAIQCRFIPTPVGNRGGASLSGLYKSVYPHTCGEQYSAPSGRSSNSGLSPHLWGTGLRFVATLHPLRFIPTPVGNSLTTSFCKSVTTVYPHTCGEQFLAPATSDNVNGLSPHLWGTAIQYLIANAGYRFIPTPVGNRHAVSLFHHSKAVYPHTCGEQIRQSLCAESRPGLSPHLWGTVSGKVGFVLFSRFIPTPVGNSLVAE